MKDKFHLSDELYSELKKAIKFEYSGSNNIIENALKNVNPKLQVKVSQEINADIESRFVFFKDCNINEKGQLLYWIASKLVLTEFASREKIIEAGHNIDSLYFIS